MYIWKEGEMFNQQRKAMKGIIFEMNPETPQITKIRKVVDILLQGGVVAFPTDTIYALGTRLSNTTGIERIRKYRNLDPDKHLTFLIESLGNISQYARVSNTAFKLLKRLTPGSFTFILPATKEVPKKAVHPKRQTVGIRIPDEPVTLALLRELGEPLLSISAFDHNETFHSIEELCQKLTTIADAVLKIPNFSNALPSTVIDLTQEPFTVIRPGAGMQELEEYFLESE